MSLRDLKDEIYLILQIKEGYSFGFATSPLVITANLAGNIHESFIIEPSHHPKFENVFVWVMDKAKMKNIWAEKLPVRIECFSVNQTQRSRIGYIILNVKDAQIAQDESKISEKQVRLLGLAREASLLKPELVLSFYITDVPIHSPQLVPQFSPRVEGSRVEVTTEPVKVMLEPGRDNLTFNISPVDTHNLDQLIPTQSELSLAELKYCYTLFGRDLVSSGGLKLSLVSCVSSVKTYFLRNPTVNVVLSFGDTTVGHTVLSLESLALCEDGAAKKAKVIANCRCTVSPTLPVTVDEAWVDFTVSLATETAILVKKKSVHAISAVGAGGDADTRIPLPLKTLPTPRLSTKSLPSLNHGSGGGVTGGETYRTDQPFTNHTVTVTVTSLQLDLPQQDSQLWLRLLHQSALVSPRDCVMVTQPWSPVKYQLCITLPSHLVHSTLTSSPPLLQLGANDNVLATASIPTALAGNNIKIDLKREDGQRMGEVCVSWENDKNTSSDLTSKSVPALTDTSLSSASYIQSKTGVDILSPRSREMKILSFVEELEDWTEKQRLIVMEGLKEEEAARLASLQAQWESEVGGQVTEGRQLLQALHNMRDDLKQQQDQLRDNQYKLKVYKEELERVHRNKLQEFKDISRRMQDEFNHKLALIASDKAALEKEMELLREENMELRHRWREVDQTAMRDQRTIDTLTHELAVLKEQLNMEVESKQFFKEHCRKAEQEIHRLNCLRQQELEEKLLSNKKSLEQLAFQHIIVEKNDLRQDQELLNEIRQQLLRAPTANSDSNGGTMFSDRTTDDRHIRRAT